MELSTCTDLKGLALSDVELPRNHYPHKTGAVPRSAQGCPVCNENPNYINNELLYPQSCKLGLLNVSCWFEDHQHDPGGSGDGRQP